jgi:hypothetical protein
MAARARTTLAHCVLPGKHGRLEVVAVHVPPESASDHLRNALQVLSCLEALNPATYMLTPELGRAARRLHAAVVLAEHGGPPDCIVTHIRGAIEAIIEANLDWDVFVSIRGCVALLMRAWYAVSPE